MASVYILYSGKLDTFYTGSCMDLHYRIGQHLNKDFINSFTAKADDWTLFYFKDNLEYRQARSIERQIKEMKSKLYLHNLKKYPEMMEKLLLRYR
ncbi:MAG: GIY-YIG nuclease family protein [Bacteroidota bacterium]